MRKVSFLLLFILFSCDNNDVYLPIYGDKTVVIKPFDNYNIGDTIYHSIPSFNLLNQDSILIEKSNFENKILLVDFFFVSCPTICPIMTSNMSNIVNKFSDLPNLEFLSLTVNPENDTPVVLKEYIRKKNLDIRKWSFLTGDKDHLYDVAYYGFLANAMQDDNAPGGFLHSSLFFLIDTNGRIRGIYDGLIDDEIEKSIIDINKLYDEEFK